MWCCDGQKCWWKAASCSPLSFGLAWVVHLLGNVARLNLILQFWILQFWNLFLSAGKSLHIFFSIFIPWENRAYGIIFFMPLHTSPMVTSSRHLGPLGEKGAGDTIDPCWGIEERGSSKIERSQESTASSQLWTLPFLPQNLLKFFLLLCCPHQPIFLFFSQVALNTWGLFLIYVRVLRGANRKQSHFVLVVF